MAFTIERPNRINSGAYAPDMRLPILEKCPGYAGKTPAAGPGAEFVKSFTISGNPNVPGVVREFKRRSGLFFRGDFTLAPAFAPTLRRGLSSAPASPAGRGRPAPFRPPFFLISGPRGTSSRMPI